jgi:hypothetical protein
MYNSDVYISNLLCHLIFLLKQFFFLQGEKEQCLCNLHCYIYYQFLYIFRIFMHYGFLLSINIRAVTMLPQTNFLRTILVHILII